MRSYRLLLLMLLLITAGACREEPDEDGIWRELVVVDAPAPPRNPKIGVSTPASLNKARFLRYRGSAEARRARAIVVCVPGMPAGAMAYDELARRLIQLSEGQIEVWSIDRRSNALEDLTGMQAAEMANQTERLMQAYEATAEWIRFADAKAGATLGANGVLTGIQVDAKWDGTQGSSIDIQLLQSGGLVGAAKTVPFQNGGSCNASPISTLGGDGDLWGSPLTQADFAAGTVGVRVGGPVGLFDGITLTAFFSPAPVPGCDPNAQRCGCVGGS